MATIVSNTWPTSASKVRRGRSIGNENENSQALSDGFAAVFSRPCGGMNQIITWVGTGYCVKQGALVLSAFAGRSTAANIVVQLFGQLSVVWSLSVTISGLSISLYLVERRLHQKTRDRLTDRITELETRLDARRTSSLLTPEGLTRKEDE